MKSPLFLLLVFLCGQSQAQKNTPSKTIQNALNETSSQGILVSSTPALRTVKTPMNNNLYFLSEKGKEGYFRLDPNDNTSPDNEGTIIVNNQGKRYKRVFEGEVNITWFGAKGDGIINDTDAFNKAVSSKSNCIYIPYKEAGYKIANVAITKTITLRGDNKFNSTIIPAGNDVSCFVTEAAFVEYRDLYFDGAGTINTTGIEHKHRISTVSNCFFSGLNKGIFNNKLFVSGGKPDEQTINYCRFRNCLYGVYSDGHFINSKIINSIFHGCFRSAIYCFDESYNASATTTEGLTIESCLIYDSGNETENFSAIELRNVDFSFIRNCVVDLNRSTCLSLTNSQYCNISGSYFSANASNFGSGIQLIGNCSNTTFDGCQLHDSKAWGFQITGLSDRVSNNIKINNCSGRLNVKGDLFIDGGTNTWVSGCSFYSNTSTSIQASNTLGSTALHVRGTSIAGVIKKANASTIIDLKDCPDKLTEKLGTVIIAEGQQSVSFEHGLTVLVGQKIIVIAGNSTNLETISATAVDNEIRIDRSGRTGTILVNYRAEVQ